MTTEAPSAPSAAPLLLQPSETDEDPVTWLVPLDLIDNPTSNPNVLDPSTTAALLELIRLKGFLQPVLLRYHPTVPGRYEIVDGVHRCDVLRTLGHVEVEAVVRRLSDADAKILQVALNRLRGELDLRRVAVDFDELLRSGSATMADVSLSGFSDEELRAMIGAVAPAATPPLDGDPTLPPLDMGGGPAPNPRPFVLELRWPDRATLNRVKKALRKAAGAGGDLEDGLLALAEIRTARAPKPKKPKETTPDGQG